MNFLGFIKNGNKGTYGLQMPAFYPASRVSYDNTNHPELPDRAQGVIDSLANGVSGTSRTVTKQSGFSGTATLTDCVGGFGLANLNLVSTNALTANTQTNIASDTETDAVNGSFVAKVTDSGGVVKGFAGVFIVTVGTTRYLQIIPNVTVPAGGLLIGIGLYRYE